MRVFLSGMPELRLGLNDKVLFEHTGRKYGIFSMSNRIDYVFIAHNTYIYIYIYHK